MREFAVVVNDCAQPSVPAIRYIRTYTTNYGDKNFTLGFDDIAAGLPKQLTQRQMDWLEILGHLFATDVACERRHGDVDWNRAVRIWLPVRDPQFWETKRDAIEEIWTGLTDDELEISFEPGTRFVDPPRTAREQFPTHDGVALVSGGQDSFVGSVALLDAGLRPLLLSHTASGATSSAQVAVEAHLRSIATGIARVRLTARRAGDLPGQESSQRSRTFLFLGVACLVASATGTNRVWLSENGVMALHLPLTAARIGSFSTHTASPPIVARIESLAQDVLGAPVVIENELVGLTKPEVVERGVALGQKAAFQDTVSCWSIGRTRNHCGVCVPCIMRRISCETHGVPDAPYRRDVFEDPAAIDDAPARDNLVHLMAQLADLGSLSDFELPYAYPELLNGGPSLTLDEAIGLHRRWATQAEVVLLSHSVPASLR